jgi:hypothetical protein
MTIRQILALPTVSDNCALKPVHDSTFSIGLELPEDLIEFYSHCDGGDLLIQNPCNRWRIHERSGLFGVEQFFWGSDMALIQKLVLEGQIFPQCLNWYVVAHCLADGDLVIVIDLNPEHFGRMYSSTSELHSWSAEDYVIANTFTEWLERLVTTPGDRPYWEASDFPRVSAYS